MKTQFETSHRPSRKTAFPARSHDRFCRHHRRYRVKELQMIYAHFGPPVVFTVSEPFKHTPGWVTVPGVTGLPEPDCHAAPSE